MKKNSVFIFMILFIGLIIILLIFQMPKPTFIGKYEEEESEKYSALSSGMTKITSIVTSADRPESKIVKVWDISSGKKLKTLQGHKGYVTQTVFSMDEKKLASRSNDATLSAESDDTIKIWDIHNGSLLHSFNFKGKSSADDSFLFSPDGKKLAAVC